MARYAEHHAHHHNTVYRSWSSDCTNFVSRALRCGGWGDIYDPYDPHGHGSWWYTRPNQSASWINAESFHRFARNRADHLGNMYDRGRGEVLQAGWDRIGHIDHTMMVHGFDSYNGAPILAYHSNDRSCVNVGEIITANPEVWFYARTVPDP